MASLLLGVHHGPYSQLKSTLLKKNKKIKKNNHRGLQIKSDWKKKRQLKQSIQDIKTVTVDGETMPKVMSSQRIQMFLFLNWVIKDKEGGDNPMEATLMSLFRIMCIYIDIM